MPENQTISRQMKETLTSKTVTAVFNATKFHKNTYYFGDPLTYGKLLTGRRIESSESYGMYVDLIMDKNTKISTGDGTNVKFGTMSKKMPDNYQLLLTFDDNTYLVYTVGMFGFIAAYDGVYDEPFYLKSRNTISPFSDDFSEEYFLGLFDGLKPTLTAKLFLGSEQRIPGVGNGVIQDILFNVQIHPKRQIDSLNKKEKLSMLYSVRQTLTNMVEKGGRNTMSDLFGNKGRYECILSKNTVNKPCPVCGDTIIKEAQSGGGAIYYCPTCQKL